MGRNMTLPKIQRTFIRDTDRRPYRPRRHTSAGWTEITRRQGGHCAGCRLKKVLHATYDGETMLAGLCMSCIRLLAENTPEQLEARANELYDKGDALIHLAEWHRAHPRNS
jgi:hypothetical protein